MNHNRKRREAERKRRDAEERERRRREEASKDGLAVDYSAFVPFSSFGPPDFYQRGYYLDRHFTCDVCGREEVWSASQQKWWYEVARGSVFSVARRCRPCRREAREYKGKADPLYRFSNWILTLRDRLGPILFDAGWQAVVGGEESRPDLLSYGHDDAILRFRWAWTEGGYTLICERRESGSEQFQQIRARAISNRALHDLPPPELRRRLDSFIEEVLGDLGLESNR